MLRAVVVLLALGLAVYAVLDVLRSTDEEIAVLPRIAWVLVAIVLPVLGPVLWLAVGRQRADGSPGSSDGGGGGRGPSGPDDDPDFLRGLGRGRRY